MKAGRAFRSALRRVSVSSAVALPTWLGALGAGAEEPSRFARWSGNSALTTAPRSVELGVFSQSAWGVNARVELRLHPVWFWVLPHAEAKLRWLDLGEWQLSSVHRLAYPTPLLSLVSREGSLGLLPATTDAPYAVLLDTDLLGSAEWSAGQWATLRIGASLGLTAGGDDVLLDFPFLYQRFAALSAPAVPRVALGADGDLSARFGYAVEYRHYFIPLADFALFDANEYAASVFFLISARHRLTLGGRLSSARLPIGWRSHFLPYLDYQIAL